MKYVDVTPENPFKDVPPMDGPMLRPLHAVCVFQGTKPEAKFYVWNLAGYGVPALVRKGTDSKWHVAVPADLAVAPSIWLASIREADFGTCTADGQHRHRTQQEDK